MKHLKKSLIFLSILVLIVLSIFAGNMIGNFTNSTYAVVDLDGIMDICLMQNTYIDGGAVDWDGFWLCVGTALS